MPDLYQLRVVLRNVSPLIWRRLLVRSDTSIAELHAVLQTAMGWSDTHLDRFRIHGKAYGIAQCGGISFADDPFEIRLSDLDEIGGGICNTCGAFHDGFALLMWANGWTFPEALRAVAGELGMTDDRVCEQRPVRSLRPRPKERDRESVIKALNRVWQQALDPADRRAAPLRAYSANRGLSGVKLDGEVVRFHPALGYWQSNDRNEPELVGWYPAMVALVTGAGGAPVTVHRTYLTPDGHKAPVPAPKKLMGYPGSRLAGGAIRLLSPGPILGVAEGVESALAIRLRTGMPGSLGGAAHTGAPAREWTRVVAQVGPATCGRARRWRAPTGRGCGWPPTARSVRFGPDRADPPAGP